MRVFTQTIATLTTLLAVGSTQLSAQTLPTETFFQDPAISHVEISPDGKLVAMQSPSARLDRILVFNTDDNKLITQTTTSDGQGILNFAWKGNDELIIASNFIRFKRDRATPSGELFAFNIPANTGRAIAGRTAGEFSANTLSHINPSDPGGIKVVRFELKGRALDTRPTGVTLNIPDPNRKSDVRTRDEVRGPIDGGTLYADEQGVFRLAVANFSNKDAQLSYRQSADADWQDISANFDNLYPQDNLQVTPVGIANGKGIYYLTSGEMGTTVLRLYNVNNGSSSTLAESENFDILPANLVYTINGSEVIGMRLFGDYIEASYFSDHPDVLLQQSLDGKFPGERVQVLNADDSKNLLVLRISGPHRVSDFILYDRQADRLRLLGSANPELKREEMADVNAFAIRNPEGQILHGYITVPQGTTEALPMVVIPNKYPIGMRALPEFNREAQFLAHNGYAVLQLNSRGAAGFGKKHAAAGTGQWGTGMIDDITLAVRWAVQNDIAQADKICLYGRSYGAFAAMASIVNQPDRYQCAAGYSGFYDLAAINMERAPYLPAAELINGRELTDQSMDLSRGEKRDQSPISNANAIKVPVFIAHGSEDLITTFKQAEDFVDELEAAGKTHEFMVKEGEAHEFGDPANELEFYQRLLGFLNDNLK